MKLKIFALLFTAATNVAVFNKINYLTADNSSSYIYGKVSTEDGDTYTGQIRWGKEEAYWFDYFNSTKKENEYLDYLTKEQENALAENNGSGLWRNNRGLWNWGGNKWYNNNNNLTHIFACQFGDIASLEMDRRERIKVILKNGDILKLEGGSNDIGADINIVDTEIGLIKLDWDRVEKVEFMPTPSDLKSYWGEPLYGTVLTESGGEFTGFVQWDHDERMAHDELNGESRDGDIDMEFGNISKIKKTFRGSEITTQSGRELELRGSNDVNDDNRGIIVNIPGQGRVDIPWDEFEEVMFTDPMASSISYSDFTGDADIFGTVTTIDGDIHVGSIAYDLDETYQLEILNGKIDDIEYFIPFSHIKSIKPMRRNKANVTLTNGTSITLEDSVDVGEGHDGVLVFLKKGEDPTYVIWEDIEKIDFK